MNVYAFDVDHTLEISQGPVKLRQMSALRKQGHVVGLCGNWAVFIDRLRESWHERVSFFGPTGPNETKADYLAKLKFYMNNVEQFWLIGNSEAGQSRDEEAAKIAGWRFCKEEDFKEGL